MKKLKLTSEQKQIRKQIIQLIYEKKLSHIGSCLSAVDLIDAVYNVKKINEPFILSGGHAALALYAVLNKNKNLNWELAKGLHIHPDRNIDVGIDVSTGSLGQGLPIAIGMALSNRRRRVFCIVTDGECAEGSIWESFRVIYEKNITNLLTIVNANGWGAYTPITLSALLKRIKGFGLKVNQSNGHNITTLTKIISGSFIGGTQIIFARTDVEQLPFLKGQDAHYYVMNDLDLKLAMEMFG
jgi:transketolase